MSNLSLLGDDSRLKALQRLPPFFAERIWNIWAGDGRGDGGSVWESPRQPLSTNYAKN